MLFPLPHLTPARAAFCVALAACVPAALFAQRRPTRLVRAVVVDSSGTPVAFSNIAIDKQPRIVSDDSGRFSFVVDSGNTVAINVRRIGYQELITRIATSSDTTIKITLALTAIALPEQHVTADGRLRSLDRRGFYKRLAEKEAGAGGGHFITPEDIEHRRPVRASQMLEGVPGMRLIRVTPNEYKWVAMGRGRCPMTVYLDRARINTMSDRMALVFIEPGSLPASGSVWAKQTFSSPRRAGWRNRSLCSSLQE